MYPDTAEQLLEALTLQETNLPIYKQQVGATAENITDNAQDRANLAAAIANQMLIENDKTAVTQIKNAVYQGDTGAIISPYPSFDVIELPYPSATGGAVTRYRERRARFKTARDYTKEIGIALGLEKATGGRPEPTDDLTASLKLRDFGSHQYQAEFKKQGQDGILIQDRVRGESVWRDSKTGLKSPVIVNAPAPEQTGAAIQIEVRARLLKGNQQVGQWSPIYSLVVGG